MEWQVDINFKHENQTVHSKLADYFNGYGRELSYSQFEQVISEVSDSNKSVIFENFSEESFTELFGGVEDVKSNEKKIRVVSICGSSAIDAIPQFMELVSLAGGKPLACKATEDESILTFKYSKNGVTVSEKSRWGDDY